MRFEETLSTIVIISLIKKHILPHPWIVYLVFDLKWLCVLTYLLAWFNSQFPLYFLTNASINLSLIWRQIGGITSSESMPISAVSVKTPMSIVTLVFRYQRNNYNISRRIIVIYLFFSSEIASEICLLQSKGRPNEKIKPIKI